MPNPLEDLLEVSLMEPLRQHLMQKLMRLEHVDEKLILAHTSCWVTDRLAMERLQDSGDTPRQSRVAPINRKLKKKNYKVQEVDISDIVEELTLNDASYVIDQILQHPNVECLSTPNVDLACGALRAGEVDTIDCVGKVVTDLECSLLAKLLIAFDSNLQVLSLSGEHLGYDALHTLTKFVEKAKCLRKLSLAGHGSPAFEKYGVSDPAISRVCERLGRLAYQSKSLRFVEINAPLEVGHLKSGQMSYLNWRMDTLGERATRSKGVLHYDVACLAGFLAFSNVEMGCSYIPDNISEVATKQISPQSQTTEDSVTCSNALGTHDVAAINMKSPWTSQNFLGMRRHSATTSMLALEKIDFTNNTLTSECIAVLMPSLKRLPNLQSLVLKQNQVGRRGCRDLGWLIEFSENFVELDLSSYNRLDTVGAIYLADALKRRAKEYIEGKVIRIHLQTNNILDAGLEAFARTIEHHWDILAERQDASPKLGETYIGIDLTYCQGISKDAKAAQAKYGNFLLMR